MTNTGPNLVSFLDAAQRTIIGDQTAETETTITIKNPVVVNIVPQVDERNGQPTGQMALQLLPVYFREFLADKKSPVVFTFHKNQITNVSFDGGFDFRLIGQYQNIFAATEAAKSATEAPVLKLFDE